MPQCKAIVYGSSNVWSWQCSNEATPGSTMCWRHGGGTPPPKKTKKRKAAKATTERDHWAEYRARLKRARLKPL